MSHAADGSDACVLRKLKRIFICPDRLLWYNLKNAREKSRKSLGLLQTDNDACMRGWTADQGGGTMEHTDYIFRISPYDREKFLPQVGKALEKRTELISRKKYPALWNVTDRLRALPGGKTRSRLRTKVLSVICLILGILLFVPGLMEPQELTVPLIAGAFAIGAGIGGLWRSRKHRVNAFEKAARKLLESVGSRSSEEETTVSFSDTGMTIAVDNNVSRPVPYHEFECAVETEDMILFVYAERVMVLQKSDLTTHTTEQFHAFLSEKIAEFW